jgi:hypothetical protein
MLEWIEVNWNRAGEGFPIVAPNKRTQPASAILPFRISDDWHQWQSKWDRLSIVLFIVKYIPSTQHRSRRLTVAPGHFTFIRQGHGLWKSIRIVNADYVIGGPSQIDHIKYICCNGLAELSKEYKLGDG